MAKHKPHHHASPADSKKIAKSHWTPYLAIIAFATPVLTWIAAAPTTRASEPQSRPTENRKNQLASAEAEVNKAWERLVAAEARWQAADTAYRAQLDTIPEVATAKAAMLEATKMRDSIITAMDLRRWLEAANACAVTNQRYEDAVFKAMLKRKPNVEWQRAATEWNEARAMLIKAKATEMAIRPTLIVPSENPRSPN